MKLNFLTRYIISRKIKNGKCFFVPTDTICGLLCKDVNKIYELKKRPKNKSVILFISNKNDIKNLTVNESKLLDYFWPGELTIIKDSISYRMPNHKELLKLLKKTGPLYCSSANISNQEVENNWREAKKIFGYEINYITNKFKGSKNASMIFDLDNFNIIRDGLLTSKLNEYIKNYF